VSNNVILGFFTIACATLSAIFFLNTRRSLVTGVGRFKAVVCVRSEHPIGFWIVTAFSGCISLFSACAALLAACALMAV
jgi:hypothetical protein